MMDFGLLEEKIGYRFKRRDLLQQALTHSSRDNEDNNERIEFLGDRVLNLVMAYALYETFPEESEGSLAKRHSALVQGRMLAVIGNEIDLGRFIILSESERQSGGAENENIVSDAMEALLGAVFLDGGLEPAHKIIVTLWGDNIRNLTEAHQDPKTELQEWVQARGLALPEYEIIDKSGPDHAPLFVIEIRVEGFDPIQAEGASRRQGEKLAAGLMLRKVLSQ